MLNFSKEKFIYALNKIKALINKKFDKTGGELDVSSYVAIKIVRDSKTGGAAIRFENENGILGTLGFGSGKAFLVTKSTGEDGKGDLIQIEENGSVSLFNEVVVARSSGPTFFRFRRTDTGVGLRFGVSQNGTTAGLYSENLAKWILTCEGNNVVLDGKAISAEKLTDGITTMTVEDIANKSYVNNAITTAITGALERSY